MSKTVEVNADKVNAKITEIISNMIELRNKESKDEVEAMFSMNENVNEYEKLALICDLFNLDIKNILILSGLMEEEDFTEHEKMNEDEIKESLMKQFNDLYEAYNRD